MFRGHPKKVSNLSFNSSFKVEVRCPICERKRWVIYKSIVKADHTICQRCIVSHNNSKDLIPGDVYNQVTVLSKTRTGISLGKCSCGTIKEFSNEALRSGKAKSCGCLKGYNKFPQVLRGHQHPMWKGGTSAERQRTMATNEYKKWRQAVFHRDSFTCQACGQVGYELNAHHIQDYSENEYLRTDVDNGITLCGDCHREFHAKYGRKNVSIDQINIFLQEVF